ncbi:NAD(P)(+) transhydrogenase (Re/Si-specific) subunit beta [Georgenia sp. 311]|uniref:NAD(P) transhydrogenase subunit beta n=1 Tax=Georgenia wutianyii TaxID=2585135 RepID=A0ABX5VIB8_9MICO|nr:MULTISPECIES: NAD(P)(+) transhydrogenase (Re/Si-specific) subunit beta [Georgenia]QDB77992.1 NAD(P)(+) transhydrogenase (Re/Si-specific) subunit beta [Georgenia wutianyii]TNC17923.1 NAD(P)(+) transhydrogenase (Re/Si-specific) subunit beta [Georgenia sp. 311]
MTLLPTWLTALGYLAAAVCFILALKGLSSPRTAVRGNRLGALGAALAVLVVLLSVDFPTLNLVLALVAILLGTVVAVPLARRVRMTDMPQLVAVFNGAGGGAAAVVGIIELAEWAGEGTALGNGASAFAVLVGAIALSGSVVTFLKLQGLMTSRPVVLPAAPIVMAVTALAAVVLAVLTATTGHTAFGGPLLAVGLVLGLLLVLPVGGADVPIVISLLNAFTGLAVAGSGLAMPNTLMLVAGTLVGASGTILTLAMARAMGRSVTGILFGALKGGSTAGSTEQSDRPVRRAQPDDVAIALAYAHRVVVVPGYGLAVAQAQNAVAELVGALRERGVDAVYGIHPVAGRMPGHMNVLLAEANVPYEQLVEADAVNAAMPSTDVVLVVGANDVVNPAARTDPSAPIYGMPIIDADRAGQVFFLKRSMRPGFAGIENELLFAERTQLVFGDAKETLTATVNALAEV